MEILFTIAIAIILFIVIVCSLIIAFGWVAHKVFGLDASWLDYGISEDDM